MKLIKILGIDPGFALVGFGLIEKRGHGLQINRYGVIKTETSLTFPERLVKIQKELNEILETEKPDTVGIEELFFNTNQKTALWVAQARGVLIATIAQKGLPIGSYTPMQVKLGVSGYGSADKHQVQHMVKILLNLDKIPKPDDAADALAIAICHANTVTSFNNRKM